jgi:hypothetical protein
MERLGEDVRRLLSAAGAPQAGALSAIVGAWPTVAGDAIARSAWPQRLARDGTRAFELARLAPELIDRLRRALGEDAPASLRFAPGPVPEAGCTDESPGSVDSPAPSAEDRCRAAEIANVIGDSTLRELVARAAAASLARPPSGRRFW